VFIGLTACAIAAIRRSGVRLFLWLGIWSAMYGAGLLTRTPDVVAALPKWLQIVVPYANAVNIYLVVVVAFLVFLELTVGKLRLVIGIIIVAGIVVALAGIGSFLLGGPEDKFIQYNYAVTVCGLEGAAHSEGNVYTEYDDPKRTEWITKIQPALKKANLKTLVRACGKKLSRREIIELRAGRKKPHRKTQELLVSVLKTLKLI
jgi:hypothetical protein